VRNASVGDSHGGEESPTPSPRMRSNKSPAQCGPILGSIVIPVVASSQEGHCPGTIPVTNTLNHYCADHGNQLLTATEVGDEGFTASMAPCRRGREAEDVQMASGKG
jgi:hypothetical protein